MRGEGEGKGEGEGSVLLAPRLACHVEGKHRAPDAEAEPYDAHRALGLGHRACGLARGKVRVGGEPADDGLLARLAGWVGGDESELEGVEHGGGEEMERDGHREDDAQDERDQGVGRARRRHEPPEEIVTVDPHGDPG